MALYNEHFGQQRDLIESGAASGYCRQMLSLSVCRRVCLDQFVETLGNRIFHDGSPGAAFWTESSPVCTKLAALEIFWVVVEELRQYLAPLSSCWNAWDVNFVNIWHIPRTREQFMCDFIAFLCCNRHSTEFALIRGLWMGAWKLLSSLYLNTDYCVRLQKCQNFSTAKPVDFTFYKWG